MTTVLSTLIRSVFAFCLTLAAWSCGSDSGSEPKGIESSAYLQTTTVKGESTSCAVVLRAQQGTQYEVTLSSEGGWCRLSNGATTLSATMETTDKVVYVYFDKNPNGAPRSADVEVSFSDGVRAALHFTQQSYDTSIAFSREWAELPTCDDNSYVYVSHYADMGIKSNVRNYTMCFDPKHRASLWVAYPLHSSYTSGNATRSDNFGYDPSVSTSYQADLSRSYRGSYDRGHQIPAADRKCEQTMMDQTFYATNMTPQQSNFNQHLWGYLEGRVRGMVCADTLYVVTGAWFDGKRDSSIDASTTDASGNTCPIPTDYFKVLLRTVKGNTKKRVQDITDASELKAICFWLQHCNSGSDISVTKEYCISVSEAERITGFEFFPMIDEAIADEVKSQCNPSAWGITQ